MPWVVDELAGAAFGPWGLAVAAGIGVGVLAGKRLGPTLAGAATGAASGVAAGAAESRDQVRDRMSSGLSDLRTWWSDVYAEAHAEWQQSRAATGGAVLAATAAPAAVAMPRAKVVPTTKVIRSVAPRVRGTNGRYLKPESM